MSKVGRTDPAPSRLTYRLHRLALTPSVRRMVTRWMPLLILIGLGVGYFAEERNRAALHAWVAEVKATIAEREEFMVRLMAVDGATEKLAAEIRTILPLDFPMSSFDLDLADMQASVARLDAVERADLHIRPGGILQVSVLERIPAAIWRTGGALSLLDAGGHRVDTLTQRADRPDLPLIAGAGADRVIDEALQIVDTAAPLAERLRGLVRVGERRWSLALDRDQRIELPAKGAVDALEQVIALHQAQELLDRDVLLVDMRHARRPVVRLRPATATALRKIKLDELGDN